MGVIASGVAHQGAPNIRVRRDPPRVSWDKCLYDLLHREIFRQFYRMEESSLDELLELPRPLL